MLETSARLLRLLSLLQSRREWTGPELAQRLEVSERTVRNDIDRLRSLGYPVDANRGAAGGYRLGAGAQLPPLLLDDDEVVATVLGLRAATGLAGVEEVSLRALAKIEQVLPRRLRRRVAALGEFALRVPDDTPSPQVDAEVLTTLAAACRDAERLRFDYRTHRGGEARRDVEPYRLIAWGRRWYLLAWDVERGDWRTFRADRIAPRVPTGPRFSPRPLPADDITAYVAGRVSAAAWRYRASVVVHAPAEEIAARITAAVGQVEARDAAACVLHTGSDSLEGSACSAWTSRWRNRRSSWSTSRSSPGATPEPRADRGRRRVRGLCDDPAPRAGRETRGNGGAHPLWHRRDAPAAEESLWRLADLDFTHQAPPSHKAGAV